MTRLNITGPNIDPECPMGVVCSLSDKSFSNQANAILVTFPSSMALNILCDQKHGDLKFLLSTT